MTSQQAPEKRPWQAGIQARLTRGVGVDQIEEVDYENGGRFTRRVRLLGGPGPRTVHVLDDQQLRQLLRGPGAAPPEAPPRGGRGGPEVLPRPVRDPPR